MSYNLAGARSVINLTADYSELPEASGAFKCDEGEQDHHLSSFNSAAATARPLITAHCRLTCVKEVVRVPRSPCLVISCHVHVMWSVLETLGRKWQSQHVFKEMKSHNIRITNDIIVFVCACKWFYPKQILIHLKLEQCHRLRCLAESHSTVKNSFIWQDFHVFLKIKFLNIHFYYFIFFLAPCTVKNS